MNRRKPLPAIVTLAILTAITTIVWVGFEVVRSFTKEPIQTVPPEITAELTPTLELDTLSKLTQRIYFEEGEIGEVEIISSDLLLPETEETPSEEPEPEEEEEGVEATPSGEVEDGE